MEQETPNIIEISGQKPNNTKLRRHNKMIPIKVAIVISSVA